jgi:diguanylate cyclase (GGDEF)-like protein/PAS domain S-box-containing protein
VIDRGEAPDGAPASSPSVPPEILRQAIDAAGDGVALLDRSGRIAYANGGYAGLFGFGRPRSVLGLHWSFLHPEAEAARVRREAPRALEAHGFWRADVVGRRRDGSEIPLDLSVTRVSAGHLLCVARDISRRRAREEQLEQLAYRDPLTGLANRRVLRERAQQALALARRGDAQVALLYLDLIGFKQINDQLGHVAGDQVLEEVARRLSAAIRDADTAARIGGDEFAVLLSEIEGEGGAMQAARRVQEAFEPAFEAEGHTLQISISIGLSLFPTYASNFDAMLDQADMAMYGARRTRSNGIRLYRTGGELADEGRGELIGELHDALRAYRMALHYQPVMDLSTGERVGSEALVRWPHPRLGILCAAKFVPLIAEPDLVRRLDRWVLASALLQLQGRQRAGSDEWLAVHLSEVALHDEGMEIYLQRVLGTMGELDAGKLLLEFPARSVLSGTGAIGDRLAALHGLGVSVAVDGLSGGHSSMAFLQGLPATWLNLDRGFVAGIGRDAFEEEVLRTVIDLAHAMGLRVRAKGIEREEQRAWLRQAGCDLGQGFLLGWIVPPDEMSGWNGDGASAP